MTEEAPQHAIPWEFRLGATLPMPPLAQGLLIAGLLLAIFLVFRWALGIPITSGEGGLSDSARESFYVALIVGYAFGALRYGVLGINRDLVTAGVEERADELDFPIEVMRRSRIAGLAGVCVQLVLAGLLARVEGRSMTAPWTTFHEDTPALWALLLIEGPEPGPSIPLGAVAIAGSLAAVALLIPVLGVRQQIRAAKHAELERVAAAIAGDPSALKGTRIAARHSDPSLADLIAFRGLIESVREWPFDAPTLSRFALYLLIPLGSWVAAAFVERAVDALLR